MHQSKVIHVIFTGMLYALPVIHVFF